MRPCPRTSLFPAARRWPALALLQIFVPCRVFQVGLQCGKSAEVCAFRQRSPDRCSPLSLPPALSLLHPQSSGAPRLLRSNSRSAFRALATRDIAVSIGIDNMARTRDFGRSRTLKVRIEVITNALWWHRKPLKISKVLKNHLQHPRQHPPLCVVHPRVTCLRRLLESPSAFWTAE
jgi:hypothetical protein